MTSFLIILLINSKLQQIQSQNTITGKATDDYNRWDVVPPTYSDFYLRSSLEAFEATLKELIIIAITVYFVFSYILIAQKLNKKRP
ncbi:MAG: hypothetical protein GWP09_01170 [Nitrospiraceae bacterium]|nr:hypothetical protein [Nitrospiraceae bacterium]